jgi:hypothetical protein
MRDYQRDPLKPQGATVRSPKDQAEADHGRSASAARNPALDTSMVLRLQRMAGNQGVVQMLASDEERSPVHDVVGTGGGSPLDAGTRSTMESAFGTSFEDVRVHTDDKASQSAESVGANAYTVGSDLVFRSGNYDPGSSAGQRTIAHELSHVVQQSQGPVDGTAASGGIKVSDPSDRFEQAADHQAERVMSSVPSPSSSRASTTPAPGSVQREEDPASALGALQREEAPDEDEMPTGE